MTTDNEYSEKAWLKFYEEGVKENIDFEEVLIPQYLEQSAKNFPDRTALIFQGFSLSFKELNEMVARFTAVLKDFGIKKETVYQYSFPM